MKNNLTCEIVEDLMPSYIDGLTNEVTNKAVREHLSQCGKCNAKLDTMTEPYSESKIEQEKKEIDFLKKNRRKNIRTKLISLIAVVLVVVIAVCTLPYGEKRSLAEDELLYNLEVDGNTFRLTMIPKDKDMIITDINKVVDRIGSNQSELVGVTTPGDKDVTAVEVDGEKHDLLEKGVEVIGRKRTLFENYTKVAWEYTYEDIKTFKLGDTILWEDGEYISDVTSELFWLKPYQAKYSILNDYADTMGLKNYIGAFEFVENTKDECQINIINEIMPQQAEEKEDLMRKYAYVFIGMKTNINSITFEYEIFNSDGDDKKCQLTITKKQADEFFGDDIKKCHDDINELQKLIEMTGFADLPYDQPDMFALEANTWDMIYFRILNNSDADIKSIHMTWPDDDNNGMGYGIERDNNFISFGHSQVNPRLYDFSLDELGENLYNEKRLGTTEFQISVFDFEGNEYILDDTVEVSAQFGAVYYLVLDGSFEEGFTVKIK